MGKISHLQYSKFEKKTFTNLTIYYGLLWISWHMHMEMVTYMAKSMITCPNLAQVVVLPLWTMLHRNLKLFSNKKIYFPFSKPINDYFVKEVPQIILKIVPFHFSWKAGHIGWPLTKFQLFQSDIAIFHAFSWVSVNYQKMPKFALQVSHSLVQKIAKNHFMLQYWWWMKLGQRKLEVQTILYDWSTL